jgi:hypothetical protein
MDAGAVGPVILAALCCYANCARICATQWYLFI